MSPKKRKTAAEVMRLSSLGMSAELIRAHLELTKEDIRTHYREHLLKGRAQLFLDNQDAIIKKLLSTAGTIRDLINIINQDIIDEAEEMQSKKEVHTVDIRFNKG